MTRNPREPGSDLDDGVPEEELVPEDDTVIGRAFRISLAVLGAVAVVAVVVVLRTRGGEEPAEPVVETPAVPAHVPEATVIPPSLPFTDVTGTWGITFVHENGATGGKLLPETMGGGVTVLDHDGDHDPDLLFVNGTSWETTGKRAPVQALFRNDGDGGFTDVTREAGLDVSFYGMGAAVADADGDGDPDLFFTAVGRNRYFRNEGGRFVDATVEAGVAGDAGAWSTGAAFVDVDLDRDLDLVVCNYIRWSPEIDRRVDYRLVGVGRAYGPPTNFEGDHLVLYENDGTGRFTDVSEVAGVRIANPATGVPASKALAVLPTDLDEDGDPDLVVANDTVANLVLRNRGDGTFEEVGGRTGLAYDANGRATGAMGLDVARYRNDDAVAVAIGNFANEMTSFYVSQGSGLFVDEAITEGIGPRSRAQLTFGLFFFDVDLDGRLDLLQCNGHLEEEISVVQASQHYRQPAQLFWNTGSVRGRTFVPVDPASTGALGTPIVGRSATYADLDGDGDQDVILTQIADRPLVLRNDQATGHHWLRVRLEGKPPNTDAIGARVTVIAEDLLQERTVMPTRSYLAQVEPVLTFGLGVRRRVTGLTVRWPDGVVQEVDPPSEVDGLVEVRQPR